MRGSAADIKMPGSIHAKFGPAQASSGEVAVAGVRSIAGQSVGVNLMAGRRLMRYNGGDAIFRSRESAFHAGRWGWYVQKFLLKTAAASSPAAVLATKELLIDGFPTD
jgi:hypothetical protein